MRIETQVLRNKVFKTQGPEMYLVLINIINTLKAITYVPHAALNNAQALFLLK
jgi:hypothetical protein